MKTETEPHGYNALLVYLVGVGMGALLTFALMMFYLTMRTKP